ncbi:MAG: adenylate/guanylate cyclase domain-containing protein [Crocinitomicaceae bacterium]
MKRTLLLFLLFAGLYGFSQKTEKEIREQLVKICYDRNFTDLKKVAEIKKKADKFSNSTKQLANYTINQLKIRRRNNLDTTHFTDMSSYLSVMLQQIEQWEGLKDQENLALGYGHLAHALYNLGIYEYASIYYKRKLELRRLDSLFLTEVYEYANCYLKMGKEVQNTLQIFNFYIKEIEKISAEQGIGDSILYEYNKLIIEASYRTKQYVECLARIEQNIRYADKLSIDKKIEAYVSLAQLKVRRKQSFDYLFEILEKSLARDPVSKRRILEAKLQFSFDNDVFKELPDTVITYLNEYRESINDRYKKIMLAAANLQFSNNKYRKAYKIYDELVSNFISSLTTDEQLVALGNAGYCAEEIGKKNEAIRYLKAYIDLKNQFEEAKEAQQKELNSIIYWFRSAKNLVEYKAKKSGLQIIDQQQEANVNQNLKLMKAESDRKLIEEQNRRRTYTLLFVGAILIITVFGFFYIRRNNKKNQALVLNILPESIAIRLKSNKRFGALKKGKSPNIIDEFPQSTILFADFKGFTKIAEKLTPEELVKELNICFEKFDEIMKENSLEKIKTIGDAYMAAGGIPEPDTDNAINAVNAAIAMVEFIAEFREMRIAEGQPEWNIRIGINTGHVVAGIIGKHKFSYDVWGDAVNVASRMESSGEAGKINISEDTYNLVKDHFECSYRGELEAKNKGKVKMYFIEGKK